MIIYQNLEEKKKILGVLYVLWGKVRNGISGDGALFSFLSKQVQKVKVELYWVSSMDVVLLKRMSLAGLLYSLDNRLVDTESDSDTKQGQQQVGDHADDAEGCQRQQQQHRHTKDYAWLFGVSPVDQILNCKEVEEGELDLKFTYEGKIY